MIFAAGFGKRMGALTAERPKPLIEVGGATLLDRALDIGRGAGIGRIVVNAHYRAEQVARHVAGSEVVVSHETPEILETGGGLKAALPLLGEGPVFTLNSDAVWRGANPLPALGRAWTPGMGALLLLLPADRAEGHRGGGDFDLDASGRLIRGGPYVYTGAEIVDPSRLDEIGAAAFSMNRYWDLLAVDGRLHGAVYDGRWCDVGHPDGMAAAERMLAGD